MQAIKNGKPEPIIIPNIINSIKAIRSNTLAITKAFSTPNFFLEKTCEFEKLKAFLYMHNPWNFLN